jgi:hypothetical protein
MRGMVHHHGMQARIAQRNLQPRTGGRIAGDYAIDVIQKMLEHNLARYDMIAAHRNFLRKTVDPNILGDFFTTWRLFGI